MIKIGIFVNLEKDADFATTKEVIKIANSLGADCEIAVENKKYDFIVSLGGDGTFLGASRTFLELGIPIIGINLGWLGFLSEIDKSNIDSALTKLISGDYKTEERFLIEITANDKTMKALNEMVINRSNLTRLIDLKLSFNGKYIDNYRADGLIISTPTGSTAYSLSAGGPIVEPKIDVILVTPVCAHSLHQRPIVVDSSTILEVSSDKDAFVVTADGQNSIENVNKVVIKKSDKTVKIIKIDDKCFFDIVREKFHLS